MRTILVTTGALLVSAALTPVSGQQATPSPAAPPAAARRSAATPTPPPVFEGVVTGPDGKPVAKAAIVISTLSDMFDPPIVVRSDDEGRFRVAARRRGPHTVRVEASGLAPRTFERANPGAPLRVPLAKGGSIDGLVKDAASGEPVAGARVEAREDGRLNAVTWDASVGVVAAVSDAKGVFRLDGLARGPHTVSASHRGAGRASRSGVTPGQRVELLVVAGPSIVGRVLLPDGKPATRAAVRLEAEAGYFQVGVTAADAAGRYELAGLPAGAYRVIATHDDAALGMIGGIRVERGDVEVDVALMPPTRVTGRLVDAGGQPVAGTIALTEIDGMASPRTVGALVRAQAAADGRFTLERVPPGSHAARTVARGVAPRRVEVEVPARAGAVDLGDVVLDTGLQIRGRVRDKAGAPIADATVRAFEDRSMGAAVVLEGATEADGGFALGGATGGTYQLSVSAPGYTRFDDTIEAPRDGLEVVLAPAGSITGTVVDAAGRAVETFEVIAMPGEGTRQPPRRRPFTDEAGRFTLDGIPGAGTYSLQVVARDSGRQVVPDVKVADGQVTDVGRITLASGGTVRGVVLDASSAPIAGATVEALAPGPVREERTTDAAGRFELRGLAPGRAVIAARHPEFAEGRSAPVEIDPARVTETAITLTRGGRIAGTVRRRGGAPFDGTVVVRPFGRPMIFSPGAMAAHFPAADGSFAVERVAPGRVVVIVASREGGMGGTGSGAMKEVEVREGETTRVDLDWRDILLTGRVTRGGAPLPKVRLMAMGSFGGAIGGTVPTPSGPQRMTAVTREDGSYEMIVGDVGRVLVRAESTVDRRSYPVRTIEVADAESQTVDIDFPASGIAGTVVDEVTGAPVARAGLSARPAEPSSPAGGHTLAGADGRFSLDLAPGEFTLLVSADGYAAETMSITVGDTPTTDLGFALSRGLVLRGRVVDDRGRPAAGVSVALRRGHPDAGASTRSGIDGRFEFSAVEPGTYVLSGGSALAGYGSVRDVSPGREEVVLTLRPGGRIRARARGVDGAPIAGALAHVLRVDDVPFAFIGSGRSLADGVLELDVPAGVVELQLFSERNFANAQVAVDPGQTAEVDVTLSEGVPPRAP
jgi:large repetitive protein